MKVRTSHSFLQFPRKKCTSYAVHTYVVHSHFYIEVHRRQRATGKFFQLKNGDVSSAVKVLMLLPAHCALALRRQYAATTPPGAQVALGAQVPQTAGAAAAAVYIACTQCSLSNPLRFTSAPLQRAQRRLCRTGPTFSCPGGPSSPPAEKTRLNGPSWAGGSHIADQAQQGSLLLLERCRDSLCHSTHTIGP